MHFRGVAYRLRHSSDSILGISSCFEKVLARAKKKKVFSELYSCTATSMYVDAHMLFVSRLLTSQPAARFVAARLKRKARPPPNHDGYVPCRKRPPAPATRRNTPLGTSPTPPACARRVGYFSRRVFDPLVLSVG